MDAVQDALSKGDNVLYGGKTLGGNYVEPTPIEIKDHDKLVETKLYREEVFASIALITSFKDLDEAIKLCNNRRYGLDATVSGQRHGQDKVADKNPRSRAPPVPLYFSSSMQYFMLT